MDWLRGAAVLAMLLGHGVDSWTHELDRARPAYRWSLFVSGIGGAPVFLFLSGVALALFMGARSRIGYTDAGVAWLGRSRAYRILGLAFLFRLQAWIISGGDAAKILTVDILNVMGVSLLGASVVWRAGSDRISRTVLLATTAVCISTSTPLVRAAGWLASLPGPIEAYLRPPADAWFSLFPWAGFVFAGCAVGLWIDAADARPSEKRLLCWLAALGAVVGAAGYGASLFPPIYQNTSFWSSSPTFFFVRLGVVLCLIPVAYLGCTNAPGRRALVSLGLSSLFVYWTHVELVYGIVSIKVHRALSLEAALSGVGILALVMYALVRTKAWFTERPATFQELDASDLRTAGFQPARLTASRFAGCEKSSPSCAGVVNASIQS